MNKMKKSKSINISGNDKQNEPEISNFEHEDNSVETGLDRTRFVLGGNNIKEIQKIEYDIHNYNNFDNSIGL